MAGRIGAYERWAVEPDRRAATAPARKGLEAKWAAEVDPDGRLAPAELARRVESKRKAHMARMTAAAAASRRAKRTTKGRAA
jgi:hypothetical protein